MSEYRARLDLGAALSLPDVCPGCGGAGLRALPAGDRTVFRCRSCGQDWHIELGWAVPVERTDTVTTFGPVTTTGTVRAADPADPAATGR